MANTPLRAGRYGGPPPPRGYPPMPHPECLVRSGEYCIGCGDEVYAGEQVHLHTLDGAAAYEHLSCEWPPTNEPALVLPPNPQWKGWTDYAAWRKPSAHFAPGHRCRSPKP